MPVEFLTGICFYNGDEPKSGLVQDFVTAYNPGMCFLSLSGIHHISRPKCERYIEQRQRMSLYKKTEEKYRKTEKMHRDIILEDQVQRKAVL